MTLLLAALLIASPLSVQQPDAATVWVYRTEEAPRGMRGKPKLRIDGKPVAEFPEREYLGLRIKAGKYALTLGQPQSATALVVEPGKTYFVQVSYKPGGHGFNGLLDEIFIRDAAQAELHFRGLKRAVESKNIKDRSLEVVAGPPTF